MSYPIAIGSMFRVRRVYRSVIPQHFSCWLEHCRMLTSEPPGSYVDHWHARIRWSRFALLWAGIGAQVALEALP